MSWRWFVRFTSCYNNFYSLSHKIYCRYHILSNPDSCIKTNAKIKIKIKINEKLQVSKPKRVKKKKKTTWLDSGLMGSQHLKILLIAIKAKTLTGYGQKLTFLFNCLIKLNFEPYHRAYFSLWNDNLRAKSGVKMGEISTKYLKL